MVVIPPLAGDNLVAIVDGTFVWVVACDSPDTTLWCQFIVGYDDICRIDEVCRIVIGNLQPLSVFEFFAFIIFTTYGQHVFYFTAEVEWSYIKRQFRSNNTEVLNCLLWLLVVVAYIDITSVEGCRRGGRHTLYVIGLSGAVIVSCRVEDVCIVLHNRCLHPAGHDIG